MNTFKSHWNRLHFLYLHPSPNLKVLIQSSRMNRGCLKLAAMLESNKTIICGLYTEDLIAFLPWGTGYTDTRLGTTELKGAAIEEQKIRKKGLHHSVR